VPHVVQEIVSTEKTPTLSLVIPMYEKLVVMLNDLKRELPELSHAISASVIKLDEYLAKSRRTKLYALAIGKSQIASMVCWYHSHRFDCSHQPDDQV
jgi:hypothetical protein